MIDVLKQRGKRATYGVIAVLTFAFTMVPSLSPFISNVSADQLLTRSIQMSSSSPGATGVQYKLTFSPETTGAQSMVIDFCSNHPIIGQSCTAPKSFTSAGATLSAGPANWALTTAATTLKINKATGSNLDTSEVSFTFTGITNPNPNPDEGDSNTFFARITTYGDDKYGADTGGVYSSPISVGKTLDEGAVALSVANDINVSAAVMETLVFCVSGDLPGQSCTDTSVPSIALGHGTPVALDATKVDSGDAYIQISSNAVSGVTVYMKNSNACGGLSRNKGTTCDIAAVGTDTAAAAITAGNALFGMQAAVGENAAGPGNISGSILPAAPYNGTGTDYGMNNVSGMTVSSTFGSPIVNTNGLPSSNINSKLTFAASASNVTPAGLYSARMTLIAVGTY